MLSLSCLCCVCFLVFSFHLQPLSIFLFSVINSKAEPPAFCNLTRGDVFLPICSSCLEVFKCDCGSVGRESKLQGQRFDAQFLVDEIGQRCTKPTSAAYYLTASIGASSNSLWRENGKFKTLDSGYRQKMKQFIVCFMKMRNTTSVACARIDCVVDLHWSHLLLCPRTAALPVKHADSAVMGLTGGVHHKNLTDRRPAWPDICRQPVVGSLYHRL